MDNIPNSNLILDFTQLDEKGVGNIPNGRNDITTLALYGDGSETILFFSMGHGQESDSLSHHYMSLVLRKPVFGVFDQDRHKPGCTATEDD